MGEGYRFSCKKCKSIYYVSFGAGWSLDVLYIDTIRDILNGKYGEEWRVLYEFIPNIVFDPDRTVFMCKCGHWENEVDVTLYEPNNPIETQIRIDDERAQFGWKGKYLYEAWLSREQRDREYHLLRQYRRICKKCGREMYKIPYEDAKVLSCPECGEINKCNGFTLFD